MCQSKSSLMSHAVITFTRFPLEYGPHQIHIKSAIGSLFHIFKSDIGSLSCGGASGLKSPMTLPIFRICLLSTHQVILINRNQSDERLSHCGSEKRHRPQS